MKYFLITFLALCLVTSCDNAKKYKTEISEIDAKQLELDSLESIVNEIEMDSFSAINKGRVFVYSINLAHFCSP